MASSALRLAITAAFLSISAAARPCKTFDIFSYSVIVTPQNLYPNPNPDTNSLDFIPTQHMTILTLRRFSHYYSKPLIVRRNFPAVTVVDRPQIQRSQFFVVPFVSGKLDSFRNRTRDILSVVVGLLFGVGCGALTAATMSLVWAIFANRQSYSFDEDYESDGNDDASPKKMGYVKIPEPAPVKEAA